MIQVRYGKESEKGTDGGYSGTRGSRGYNVTQKRKHVYREYTSKEREWETKSFEDKKNNDKNIQEYTE